MRLNTNITDTSASKGRWALRIIINFLIQSQFVVGVIKTRDYDI